MLVFEFIVPTCLYTVAQMQKVTTEANILMGWGYFTMEFLIISQCGQPCFQYNMKAGLQRVSKFLNTFLPSHKQAIRLFCVREESKQDWWLKDKKNMRKCVSNTLLSWWENTLFFHSVPPTVSLSPTAPLFPSVIQVSQSRWWICWPFSSLSCC